MEFLQSFLRRYFTGKPLVASRISAVLSGYTTFFTKFLSPSKSPATENTNTRKKLKSGIKMGGFPFGASEQKMGWLASNGVFRGLLRAHVLNSNLCYNRRLQLWGKRRRKPKRKKVVGGFLDGLAPRVKVRRKSSSQVSHAPSFFFIFNLLTP